MNRDGWANLLTGMGMKGKDKTQATKYNVTPRLHFTELESLYEGDGLARLIVDVVAETMTREWVVIEADDRGDEIIQAMEDLNAKSAFTDLIRWSRLHGGAVMVMGLLDGNTDLAEPLNEKALDEVIFLKVFDKSEVSFSGTDLYSNPTEPKYGTPKVYNISSVGGLSLRVHESRVLRMDGDPLTNRQRATNNYWGASVLQACYDDLKGLGTAYSGCVNLVSEFVLGTLTVNNLQDLIGAGQEELIIKRLMLMDMSKSIMNSVIVDENEKYTRESATVTGLPDLLDRFVKRLSATSRIPVTVLMGQAPAGLNATGDSDIRNWYDTISAEQNDRLHPVLKRFIYLLMLAKRGPTGGKVPKEWVMSFAPLWQRSDNEEADMRKTVAEADDIYIANGTLDPSEVRHSRFGANAYSMETSLDDTAWNDARAAAEERELQALKALAEAPTNPPTDPTDPNAPPQPEDTAVNA